MMRNLFLPQSVKLHINNFTLQAFIYIENCDQVSDVFASATAMTGYGALEPVRNASVVSNVSSSDCVIEWEHDDYYDPNILKDKVS